MQHALDYQLLVPGVRGRVHELRGELAQAIAAFRSVHEVAAAVGMRNSGVILTGRAPLAILLARTGDHAAGEELAREDLTVAREWQAPRFVGIAQRTLRLVLGGEQGIELLREAVDLLDASPSILERISARLTLGSSLRRAGRLT